MSKVVCFAGTPNLLRLIREEYVGHAPVLDLGAVCKTLETLGIPSTDANRADYIKAHLPPLLKGGIVLVLGVKGDAEMIAITDLAGEGSAVEAYDVGHADALDTDIIGFILTTVTRITHVNDMAFLSAVGHALTE